MKPEAAINHVIQWGPYHGRSIGWIVKVMQSRGLQYLLRQYETASLRPETMEAIRSFFAAPKYHSWLCKVFPSYPGSETFWLPADCKGCRACGEAPLVHEEIVRCSHGRQRGLVRDARCPCGWREYREWRLASLTQKCEPCDVYPLFAAKEAK